MAVYTEVTDDDLASFLREYDIGEATSFKGIAEGVENSNYFLQTDRASYILTLYEKRVDPADLPFFLGLMDFLAGPGLLYPTPIHGPDGAALRQAHYDLRNQRWWDFESGRWTPPPPRERPAGRRYHGAN